MKENKLTLDILDAAITKVKEYHDRIPQEIRINPCDLKILCQFVKVDIHISEDSMWGIKVVEVPELPEGTMLLYYDKDNFVKVENLAVNEVMEEEYRTSWIEASYIVAGWWIEPKVNQDEEVTPKEA